MLHCIKEKCIRLGIIGSGFGLYGLLPAFHSVSNCQIVAFCGKSTQRVVDWMKRLSLDTTIHLHQDWHTMFANEQIDAVVIAVPPYAQFEIIQAALEKKIHVFAEKPLTVQLTQAYQLLELATRHQITHGIDFLFPEIDVWQTAKRMIDEKKFGEVKEVVMNWDFHSYDLRHKISSWKSNISLGGGALSFYFSHVFHYLEHFIGAITKLTSSPKSINEGEVGVDLTLGFTGGAIGNIHLSCDSKELMRHQLIFTCQHGQIVLENRDSITENFVLTTIDQDGGGNEVVSSDITLGKHADNDERVLIVKRLAQKFIHAISTGQQMVPSFIEGVRVQELIELAKSVTYVES